MFESDHSVVQRLLDSNDEFRRLYEKHSELNSRVDQANAGLLVMDDTELENIKKQKLHLRDQMYRIIHSQRSVATSTA
ncbi:MAG: DUF465 domain-containing protein [Gammaproteobacteria bacterium]|nr:MAG: DUF465 domain-containing protein [Gammaproteobacteria bacterium]